MSRFKTFQQEVREGSVFESSVEARLGFIKKVYLTFLISMGVALGGSIVGMQTSLGLAVYKNYFAFVILEVALLIGTIFLRKKEPVNRILFFSFTFVTGLTLAPMLLAFQLSGNFGLVYQALGLTVAAFGGLTAYAWTTKKDFSYLQGFLWTGLLVLIGATILSFFFKAPFFNTAIAAGGVILFSMFVLYDTHNIMKRYDESEYISGAIDLFLDFLNLFLYILRLLSSRD
ncbi:Bax inhibitor-1/YccA family protein [bacterium]|nr:Bax inhibitor-1/YccA family protein [bacterium]